MDLDINQLRLYINRAYQEELRPVRGYESSYACTPSGVVISANGAFVKGTKHGSRHLCALYKNGRKEYLSIPEIVLTTFPELFSEEDDSWSV